MPITGDAASFDVIVLGAGLTGIIAAQRLLQAHPETRLAILEGDECVGGVWSKRRLYPNFWTQWVHGIAEFSDMPMKRPPAKDCMHDLFRAEYTTEYLEDYVDTMSHGGQTLRDRIQFNTHVESIKKVDGKWRFICVDAFTKTQRTVVSSRVMMANGQASIPNIPNFPGQERFHGKIIHSRDFGQSDVVQNKSVQHVSVIGAGKSAADMVYEAVKAGKTVSWIIRKTGNDSLGPAAFAPISLPTPYKNAGQASQARIMASLQPCYLIPNRSWWTWFLHSTTLGAKLVSKIFSALDNTVRNYAGYRERKGDKGFDKLEYDNEIFWQNGTAGGCHFDDFWPIVAAKSSFWAVTSYVLMTRMTRISPATPSCLPFPKDLEAQEDTAKWEKLVGEADERVLQRFVMLRTPPKHYHKYDARTPYRLYQTMAPVNDDSILFMNHIVAGAKLFAAEAQAIWAVAYWDKAFKLPSAEEREKDIAHMIAWNKRRYLSNGELGNFAAFDSVPYVDRLLDEIGLTAHRSKGWLGNVFSPIMPADLGRAWREYLKKRSKH